LLPAVGLDLIEDGTALAIDPNWECAEEFTLFQADQGNLDLTKIFAFPC
jgi:hypothetical protein